MPNLYSLPFSSTTVRAFIECHPRAYRVLQNYWNTPPDLIVKVFREDQIRWNNFKKLIFTIEDTLRNRDKNDARQLPDDGIDLCRQIARRYYRNHFIRLKHRYIDDKLFQTTTQTAKTT